MAFNKSILISMLVIGILSFIMTSLLFSLASTYSVNIDPKYESSFNMYNESLEIINTHDNISNSGDIYKQGFGMNVYTNSIVAAKQMQASGNLFFIFVQEIPSIFQIPSFIIMSIVTIVLALSTFGFLYVITKGDP